MNLPYMTAKRLMNDSEVRSAIALMAGAVFQKVPKDTDIAVVGIQRRGVPLAERLAAALKEKGAGVEVGRLDITFYRDDAGDTPSHPIVHDTDIPFDITGKTLVLVDDVLFTGRTIRSALDELMDFGRPARICLAVLVDRGHREMPIQADFVGKTMATAREERVDVRLAEVDGEDAVWLTPAAKASRA